VVIVMGVDWWVEKLIVAEATRTKYLRYNHIIAEKLETVIKKTTDIDDKHPTKLDTKLSNLATKMSRYPEKELLFLGAITGCEICPTEVVCCDEFDVGVTQRYYEDIKKIIDCIESLYLTGLYERIKPFNVEGAYFESFESFVTFFHQLLKTIYELYKKGEYYAIFEG